MNSPQGGVYEHEKTRLPICLFIALKFHIVFSLYSISTLLVI